jgi:predicted phosphate transport protein (TIGR00153 family)
MAIIGYAIRAVRNGSARAHPPHQRAREQALRRSDGERKPKGIGLKNPFFRKQVHIEQGFEEFLGCIQRCLEIFTTGLLSYLEHGPGESFERSRELVMRAESEADNLRREIERVLYKNELLPDSRSDLLNLLEFLDKVANRVEAVINNIYLRKVEVPDEVKANIKEMLTPTQTCVETLLTAVRLLFSEPRKSKPATDDVERLESECDKVEHATIRGIYEMDIDEAHKIQLERLVNDVGSIADRAENAAHILEIIAIKRTL